jgi:hypothetical protein
MTTRNGPDQRLLVTHAVLTGLTPLIPVPFLDDLVKAYFQRRLVRRLGERHGVALAPDEVSALADDPSSGCLSGCVVTLVLYPIKKLFRKIFFVLEWKRAVDTASRTYHRGLLYDYALGEGLVEKHAPPAVRASADAVLKLEVITPVERAIRGAFTQSKSVMRGAAEVLRKAVGGTPRGADPSDVAAAVEAVEAEEERAVGGIVGRILAAVEAVPQSHFDRLRDRLREQLGDPRPGP